MRRYLVEANGQRNKSKDPEIIEADRIRTKTGAVEFQVDDPSLCSEYSDDNWRTIAIRQNANVTEVTK